MSKYKTIIFITLILFILGGGGILLQMSKSQNDTEVWIHEGMRFYEQGKCPEAIAALYHASVAGNGFAEKLMNAILKDELCTTKTR